MLIDSSGHIKLTDFGLSRIGLMEGTCLRWGCAELTCVAGDVMASSSMRTLPDAQVGGGQTVSPDTGVLKKGSRGLKNRKSSGANHCDWESKNSK